MTRRAPSSPVAYRVPSSFASRLTRSCSPSSDVAAGSPPSGVMPRASSWRIPRWPTTNRWTLPGLPQLVPAALGQGEHVGVERPAERLLRGHHQQGVVGRRSVPVAIVADSGKQPRQAAEDDLVVAPRAFQGPLGALDPSGGDRPHRARRRRAPSRRPAFAAAVASRVMTHPSRRKLAGPTRAPAAAGCVEAALISSSRSMASSRSASTSSSRRRSASRKATTCSTGT